MIMMDGCCAVSRCLCQDLKLNPKYYRESRSVYNIGKPMSLLCMCFRRSKKLRRRDKLKPHLHNVFTALLFQNQINHIIMYIRIQRTSHNWYEIKNEFTNIWRMMGMGVNVQIETARTSIASQQHHLDICLFSGGEPLAWKESRYLSLVTTYFWKKYFVVLRPPIISAVSLWRSCSSPSTSSSPSSSSSS